MDCEPKPIRVRLPPHHWLPYHSWLQIEDVTYNLVTLTRIFNVLADEQYLYFLNVLVGPIIRAFGRRKNGRFTSMWQLGWQASGEEAKKSFGKGFMFKLMTTVLVLHPLLVFYWCILVPAMRLSQQDYGQGDGDSSKANLKPAMM
uniref:Uncharacterized protein n=1 Tax=Oryza brachyantha TaxID=4533 RepID=J3N7V3_ORYBR